MATNGLDIVDRTAQTTNAWLGEISQLGPDRWMIWEISSTVLRTFGDRLPIGIAPVNRCAGPPPPSVKAIAAAWPNSLARSRPRRFVDAR
jgi:hypothetical protein